jgi:hypothetical protein
VRDTNKDEMKYSIAKFINDQTTRFKYGYCVGAGILYQAKKKLGFELDIQYSSKGFALKKTTLQPLQPEPNLPDAIKTTYHNQYLDFPLLAHMNFGQKKKHFWAILAWFITYF